ncbi:MAG: adenylosuccinate synthase [Thermoplasmatota archaeon]
MMTSTVILGTQWGDEGKGKITDILTEGRDAVVRYQGGNNAGHTIVIGDKVFKLHIVPSGVIRQDTLSIIGDGCVVDPFVLMEEINILNGMGVDTGMVLISDRAHVIMPYHRFTDGLEERARKEGKKVGTTGRGIGPCYQDKAGRFGIRMGDLRYPAILREKIERGVERAGDMALKLDVEFDMNADKIMSDVTDCYGFLSGHIRDTSSILTEMVQRGSSILLEGAQGVFLDIDKGTYPFVTSSSCSSGYGSAGSGIGPLDIKRIIGIVKAYTTRVGEGPFPTELTDETGRRLRESGREFGTTTERPRRCGWLDLVMVRSSTAWNSITDLALTKLDVLAGIDPVKVCVEYEIPGKTADESGYETVLRYFPSHIEVLKEVKPRYIEMEGFGDISIDDLRNIRSTGEVPEPVSRYIDIIERETSSKVSLLSYGPDRNETIILDQRIL